MLKLHHAPDSRAGRIVWLLEELQLPYELNRMAFHPKALKSDEHRARHPLGRVPVLEDGAVLLYESGAIVEYLIARHSDGALRPAVDSPLFPRDLQWFHYGRDCMLGELSGGGFMLGHACHMARRLGCMPEDMVQWHAYVKRLEARPAYHKGIKA
jgi:glutathione S-transferase